MATGYYLLDNPVTGPRKWYETRTSPIQGIACHITAGLEDLDGVPDHSAERTAAYCASTDRAVSWHAGADTDSVVRLLPPTFTAFHVAGYNSETIGLEISKRTTDWRGMDPAWVAATLANAAAAVRPWVQEFDVPIRKVSRYEWDRGERGFIGHVDLDPDRRTDPGTVGRTDTFPWARFLALVQQEDDMTDPQAAQLDAVNAAVARLETSVRDANGMEPRLVRVEDVLAEQAAKLDALLAAVTRMAGAGGPGCVVATGVKLTPA